MSSEGPRGLLLVVSSPSGAGKSTLCKRLRDEFPKIGFSVSYTTRLPRPGETEGVEYHFVSSETFTEMVAREEFAEHALVHSNMYGTSVAQVNDALEAGRDLLFDIDFQGGRQLRDRFGDDVVSVFILPPLARGAGPTVAYPGHGRQGGHRATAQGGPPGARALR